MTGIPDELGYGKGNLGCIIGIGTMQGESLSLGLVCLVGYSFF